MSLEWIIVLSLNEIREVGMFEEISGHIKILSATISFILAVLTTVVLYQRMRRLPERFWRPLFLHTVIMDCLVLFLLVSQYVKINLPQLVAGESTGARTGFAEILLDVMVILMVFFCSRIVFGFLDRSPPRWLEISLLTFLGIALVGFLFTSLLPGIAFMATIHGIFVRFVFENFLVLEMLLLAWLFYRGMKTSDENPVKARGMKAFALVYMARYISALVVIFFVIALDFSGVGKFAISLIWLLGLCLSPWLWLHFFWRAESTKPLTPSVGVAEPKSDTPGDQMSNGNLSETPESTGSFEEIAAKMGLSTREKEITLLIIQGKSNPEIEEELFISIHTVKNHVYNIYKKAGVKSRYALMALFK